MTTRTLPGMGKPGKAVIVALVAAGAGVLLIGVDAGTTSGPGLPNPNVSTTTTEPCVYYDPANVDSGLVYCPWVPT